MDQARRRPAEPARGARQPRAGRSRPVRRRTDQPAIKAAEKVDPIRTAVVPAVLMFVMFFVIMTSTPQLLNSVIEEKMSKISEVLLGSITPFELMMGKLLGNTGIAMVLAALYVGGGYAVAAYYGYADVVSPGLLVGLGLYLVLAILLYGSLYMAVGLGLQRAEGRPVADDAGHAAVDVPGLRLDGRAAEPVEHAVGGHVAVPAGQPVPDADAAGDAARAAGLAGRAVGRRDDADGVRLRLGRRQDLPHRAAHAGQGPQLPRAGAVGDGEVRPIETPTNVWMPRCWSTASAGYLLGVTGFSRVFGWSTGFSRVLMDRWECVNTA